MKQRRFFTVIVLLLLLFIAGVLPACNNNDFSSGISTSESTATNTNTNINNDSTFFGELYTCKSITADNYPIDIAERFSEEDPIFLSFKPKVTNTHFSFSVVKVSNEERSGSFYSTGYLDPISRDLHWGVQVKSTRAVWGEGQYEILLYLDGSEVQRLTFGIE